MLKELNHRELYVFEYQDKLALKEMAAELHISVNCVHKMKVRANNFLGRTTRKKRANKKNYSEPNNGQFDEGFDEARPF